jgi:UDP-N-acetylglucosamine--N-acetylmuramyl-(pentapeptide) pyrophosphoryl-undecaprenol N-acetylglucosamine transferase
MKQTTILFAAGGTGGHLYPAIAIAEEIKKLEPEARIVFIGTKKKIEARVVPAKGFEIFTIWISGFHRRWTLDNILFPVKVLVSLVQSFFVIRKIHPDVVVGTGGYVCGPILFVASLMDIPTVVHESNSYPGLTTRMLAGRATKVFITFDVTKKWLDAYAKIELVGNPTREALSRITKKEGCAFYNFSSEKKTIFVFGGSLGAQSINRVMPIIVDWAIAHNIQLIWQTGESDWQSAAATPKSENIRVMKFIEAMEFGYAAADVVISRSGATTLAELTRLGKPAILVPYPYAAANHQELNAQSMVDAKAAVVITDGDLLEKLLPIIQELIFNDGELKRMSENSLKLGKPNAGKTIAEKILALHVR